MSAFLAVAILLAPKGSTFKLPIYNAAQKNPAVMDYAVTNLPNGFTDTKIGSGLIKSDDGTISISLLRASNPMPSLLRNSTAKKGDGFTTIRMTNWIGYRNERKNGEDYKLDWSKYRVSIAIDVKNKANLPKMREALHTIIDGLALK